MSTKMKFVSRVTPTKQLFRRKPDAILLLQLAIDSLLLFQFSLF